MPPGDEVLGEHLDRVLSADAVVEVAPQPLEEPGELLRGSRGLVRKQAANADDVLLGDLGDILGPRLPVASLADLLDDPGVDRVAPLLAPERQRQLGGIGGRPLAALSPTPTPAGVDDDHPAGALLVEIDLVDHGVEPVVVGTQRLEHLPDDLEAFVVAQRLLRRDPGGDDDGQDDVSHLLHPNRVLAHHPADGLDDVDLGPTWGEEHDGVERRDVNALGEAAGVGEHPAHVVVLGGTVLEPLQEVAALEGVHRPVDVLDLDAEAALRLVGFRTLRVAVVGGVLDAGTQPVDDPGEGDLGRFGGLDVLGERDRPPHRGEVDPLHPVGQDRAEPLGETVPAAYELGGVAELDLAGGAELLLEVRGDEVLVDLEDEHLVVGQQVALDRLPEAEPVQHRAVDALVVHRGEDGLVGACLVFGVRIEQARRRRHVKTFVAGQVGVVVDPDEVRLVRVGEGDAGGAVGLVADDEVKGGHALGLRAGDDVDRVVGGEHDGELVVLGALGDLPREDLGVGGGGIDQVVDQQVLRGVRLADLHVRAHGIRTEGQLGLLLPLAQALVEELDRGDEEQHRGRLGLAAGRELLGDLERGEGLAGAARHDQLAAVARRQTLPDGLAGLALVRQERLLASRRKDRLRPRPVDLVPVDLGLHQVADADPHHRDGEVVELALDGRAPLLGRGDDDPAGEPLLARGTEEGVDVLLGHVVLGVVELALHRAPAARGDVLRDDVDAVVMGGAPARPLLPEVDLLEAVRELRSSAQVAGDEPLEGGPLLRGVLRTEPQLVEQFLERHR